jgi:hypothetical protein
MLMEVPMTMHTDQDQHTTDTASDGTREAIWMAAALFAVAIAAIWYFAT